MSDATPAGLFRLRLTGRFVCSPGFAGRAPAFRQLDAGSSTAPRVASGLQAGRLLLTGSCEASRVLRRLRSPANAHHVILPVDASRRTSRSSRVGGSCSPASHATISFFATAASSTAPAARGIAPIWRSRATPSSASPLRYRTPAARTIDVSGLVVAPGFIDIHTHARRGIFEVPTADNYVRQGVTTLVEGPDGSSPLPLRAVLREAGDDALHAELRELRRAGIDSQRRWLARPIAPATAEELEKMRQLVRQGMEDGAFGLSSGLFYVPGTFTPTAEVVELARVAGQMGGIYISHMRDEASGHRRQRSRDDRHRRTGRPADAGDPPQGHRQDVLGPLGRDAAADRRGPRARRRRDDRSVSVHRVVHEHRRGAAAGVGAGRRTPGADEAPGQSRHAREDQGGERGADPQRAWRRRSAQRRRRELPASIRRSPGRTSPRSPPSAACRSPSRTPPRRRCGS